MTAESINLQTNLLNLQNWSEKWQMEFNPTKCKHIQNTNNLVDAHFTIPTYIVTIQKVANAKYLGLTFDCHLSWKSHINNYNSYNNNYSCQSQC